MVSGSPWGGLSYGLIVGALLGAFGSPQQRSEGKSCPPLREGNTGKENEGGEGRS